MTYTRLDHFKTAHLKTLAHHKFLCFSVSLTKCITGTLLMRAQTI